MKTDPVSDVQRYFCQICLGGTRTMFVPGAPTLSVTILDTNLGCPGNWTTSRLWKSC